MKEIKEIPIGQIMVGEHEQRLSLDDDSLNGLVASIKRLGILQPLIVRKQDSRIYLVAGHRRLAAAKKVGLESVPCIVRVGIDDLEHEVVFAENFFRKDLSPVELACAMKDIREKGEIGLAELAAGFHRSEHWVVRMIAIADWPGDVQEAIHEGSLSVSAASNLAVVFDNAYRGFLVRNAVEQGATARTTASWLQAWRAMQPAEEAITSEPVSMGTHQTPMVPQAPCFICAEVFKVDEVSYVPICGGCIKLIKQGG